MKKIFVRMEKLARTKPTICLIILLFVGVIMITVSMLISYAYFTSSIQGEGKQITISRSNLIVHFNNGEEINETGITPGDTITKTFYVKNNTNNSESYKINWKYIINNFENSSSLKYTITSTNNGGMLSNVTLPTTSTNATIINNITIAANATQTYTMTITYRDDDQGSEDLEKKLIGRLEISDTSGNEILPETSKGSYDRGIESEKNLFNFTLSEAVDLLYPVGSIYTSTTNDNPSTLFPGTTWERHGKGKTLVGVDENDTSFDTVNETGGTKDEILPYHRHGLNGVSAKAESAGDHTHDITGQIESEISFADKIKDDNPPVNSPTTTPGREISTTDEGLITGSNDDYGGTTYYFRGNIQDNYVSFAGKTWRIIRINGDGSVRLILEDTIGRSQWNTNIDATSGNNYQTSNLTTAINWLTYGNSPVKATVDNWYNTNIGNHNNYDSLVATGKFCNDMSHTDSNNPNYYDFAIAKRIRNSNGTPQFTCPNSSDINNLKVALITGDEATFAGGVHRDRNLNSNYYLSSLNTTFWTITPASSSTVNSTFNGVIDNDGDIGQYYLAGNYYIRPVINLRSDVVYDSGNGTSGSPYTVKEPTAGTHTHNIAANAISVRSTATTTTTAQPEVVNGVEVFENGVDYGEHGHTITGTGTNTSAYTITSSGDHTHTTTEVTGQTTGAGSSHSHSIPSLTVTTETGKSTGSESSHTHGFTVPALSGSTSSTSKTLTGQWYNTTARFPGTSTVSGIISKVSGSINTYWRHTGGKDTNTYGFKVDATHTHNITTTAKGSQTTGAGSSHNHSIPALSGSTTASTTGNESSHTHSFDIPSLNVESSGAHTHAIPAETLTIGLMGKTIDATEGDDYAGWHVHTVSISRLTSTNESAISLSSTGSSHSHTITGSATSSGDHTHTLSGYSGYAGTSESTSNKNLQPYIAVYIWKRVS